MFWDGTKLFVSLSEGLVDTNKLLSLSIDDIKQKLYNISFPAFVFLDEHDDTDGLLREILVVEILY